MRGGAVRKKKTGPCTTRVGGERETETERERERVREKARERYTKKIYLF